MYNEATTFLLFSIHSKRYAIETVHLKKIMHSSKAHFLPFVPQYIEGVINVDGVAYTAINPILIFHENDNPEIEGHTYLVFNRDDDRFAMHVSNIELFHEAEEEDISKEKGIVMYKGKQIPIFNTDLIEEILLQPWEG